jgi:uncharacterized protein YjfI (DUF2170 family)
MTAKVIVQFGKIAKQLLQGHMILQFQDMQQFNTIGLRLWKSLPLNEFDLFAFNRGEYYNALEARQRA